MKTRMMLMTMLMMVCFALNAGAKTIKTVVLKTTPEMHCTSCENRIKDGLKFEKGVKDIVTNLTDKTVTVTYDADKTNEDKIIVALAKIQYAAVPYDAQAKAAQTSTATAKKSGGCCGGGGCKCGQAKSASADTAAATPKAGSCKCGQKKN